ncbi:MAG: hypothetical protein H0A75_00050 [Candidatus Methanofishera endochildressiae]|uniref:Uncharacterized protein n=1 Tax=Candidatus Methanofishera endochildressiae TaxID=2738884 RepID=A0A7Z0MMA9_9GAMM|nr:hypothetical protein [Candidatus Methanofishera endochildressiae]
MELTLDDIRLKPDDIGKLCVGAVEAGVDKQVIKEKIRELGADQVKGLSQDGLKAMMIFLTEEVNKSNKKVASS